MSREHIATGKTIDEAVESGCVELGVSRDDVTVEVLETPTKRFLGRSTPAKVKLILLEEGATDKADQFLSEILGHFDIEATLTHEEGEEGLKIDMAGDRMGIIIGRHGETLDALQYLTNLVANRGTDDYVKITLDTENYRDKRAETLVALANKVAGKVVKYGRPVTLEPMNPYERRIIHSALQDYEGVTTSSVGEDFDRKVIVFPEGAKIPPSSRPNKNRRRRRPSASKPAEASPAQGTNHEK